MQELDFDHSGEQGCRPTIHMVIALLAYVAFALLLAYFMGRLG